MVAQQILSILSALTANLTRFYFEGFEINLVWSCGIFITMNPGKWQELMIWGRGRQGTGLGVWGKYCVTFPLCAKVLSYEILD